jgi:hypothetical protein
MTSIRVHGENERRALGGKISEDEPEDDLDAEKRAELLLPWITPRRILRPAVSPPKTRLLGSQTGSGRDHAADNDGQRARARGHESPCDMRPPKHDASASRRLNPSNAKSVEGPRKKRRTHRLLPRVPWVMW